METGNRVSNYLISFLCSHRLKANLNRTKSQIKSGAKRKSMEVENKTSNYLISRAVPGPTHCVLETVGNMQESLDIIKGVKFGASWPKNVHFHMALNFPKAIELPDWIKNLPNGMEDYA